MKNFYKVFLGAFFLPMMAFAQTNFKPGYIVNLKGDTIRGFIDYREWNSNPTSIDFKTAVTDKIRKYTDKEIRNFTVTGLESYQRYSGPISMDATDKDHLSSSRDTSQREVTVLFKVLQKGNNLALYAYTDELKTRFYIGESPDYKLVSLVYRIYQSSGTKIENTYMKQLFALANKYGVCWS